MQGRTWDLFSQNSELSSIHFGNNHVKFHSLTKWKNLDIFRQAFRYAKCFSLCFLSQKVITSTTFWSFVLSMVSCYFHIYYFNMTSTPSWTPIPCPLKIRPHHTTTIGQMYKILGQWLVPRSIQNRYKTLFKT
jgi:hypothetical protein